MPLSGKASKVTEKHLKEVQLQLLNRNGLGMEEIQNRESLYTYGRHLYIRQSQCPVVPFELHKEKMLTKW